MSYEKQDCPLCHGEGRLEESVQGGYYSAHAQTFEPLTQERECPLCHGCGSVDRPTHSNIANGTPYFGALASERKSRRSSTNKVVAQILGLTVDELKKAA